MKKIYQTVIDRNHGNCMQAVVASLFELELDEVPNFIEFGSSWHGELSHFFSKRGYDICSIYKGRHDTNMLKKIALFDKGINGFFYGTVKSKLFEDLYHAVVIDINLNIAHDPNPNDIYLSCTPEDVESIMVVNDMIIGKTGKLFTIEEWDNTTEEERNNNTHQISK